MIDHETRGLGRIAGSTYNIVGKLVVPPLLGLPPGAVLEIGTLFGLFAPALVRQLRRNGEFRHLTVLDPLAGVQIQPGQQGGTDPTGTPVSPEIVRRNRSLLDVSDDEVRVLQGYSSDPAVQAVAADRSYALVNFDGDHSEEGVYRDLWWVESIVVPGGVVVMDDYGDPKWPGVLHAAERYLSDRGRLELRGTASTSAYLRMPA